MNLGPEARQVCEAVDGAVQADGEKPGAARLASFADISIGAISRKPTYVSVEKGVAAKYFIR